MKRIHSNIRAPYGALCFCSIFSLVLYSLTDISLEDRISNPQNHYQHNYVQKNLIRIYGFPRELIVAIFFKKFAIS